MYFRRLYAGSSFCVHDPHLVAPGCLYLASKVGFAFLFVLHAWCLSSCASTPSWLLGPSHLMQDELLGICKSPPMICVSTQHPMRPINTSQFQLPNTGCIFLTHYVIKM